MKVKNKNQASFCVVGYLLEPDVGELVILFWSLNIGCKNCESCFLFFMQIFASWQPNPGGGANGTKNPFWRINK
jgi:hypothetical protein